MSRLSLALIAVLAALGPAEAQHAPASPYAGWEHRPVKALSKEQIADLRAGRGMGLALPAELNGYPGPVHVLELGDQLRLTNQRIRVQELHAAMKAEAIPLSERLMTQEADLDRQFAIQSVMPAILQAASVESPPRKAPCGSPTCATTSRRWTSSHPSRSGGTASFVATRHWRVTGTVPRATTKASLAPEGECFSPYHANARCHVRGRERVSGPGQTLKHRYPSRTSGVPRLSRHSVYFGSVPFPDLKQPMS
jgi:hypothetical protein